MCVRQVIVLLKVLCLTSDFSVVHSSGDRYISAHILAPGWETKQATAQSFAPLCGALEKWCFPSRHTFVDLSLKSSVPYEKSQNQGGSNILLIYNIHCSFCGVLLPDCQAY